MKQRLILYNLFLRQCCFAGGTFYLDHLQICQYVFYSSLETYTSLSYSRQCVYATFYIKHHVALPLMIPAPRMRLVQSTGIRPTTNVSERRRVGNRHRRFLEIKCRRGGRSRGRISHLSRSLVASEGWSLVRDRTNRKHCPSHKIWSYKRDGRW